METHIQTVDVLVIGGGTAGPMAAAKAKEANPALRVLLLEKANVKRSGAISMGMDGLNNAIVPGFATPEQYVKEITTANDGIVNQKTVMAYAQGSFPMIEELDRWGVKFEKDETGDYAMRKVHHMGTYVLPMPEGHDIKKVLYRRLKRARVEITNRLVATRLLTAEDGSIAGAMAFDCRTGDFHVIRAKTVVLSTGAAGRLGLPASGYLFGTYENPTNAGDGYSMAYHAGAELSGIECFQINPLIKDYNGPACAYVTGPFGGFTTNSHGERFIECDYWSGQMMQEFYNELQGGNGPVFLKLNHLAEETISTIETILHTNERPSRGRFHEGRGTNYREQMVEMHISEIGLCSGHSASGVWVNEHAETTVPGLYAAGDLACVPHNYMLGAFVYGKIAGESAARYCAEQPLADVSQQQVDAERERVWAPLQRTDGLPPNQVEYKLRRMVNDYLQPPKVTRKMEIGLSRFESIREDLDRLQARNPHELMRALEVHAIRDCAEMAARASLYRTESRWGLYHNRVDYPERNDAEWLVHVQLQKQQDVMTCFKRPIEPYIVALDDQEKDAYQHLRIKKDAAAGITATAEPAAA
ncbi:MULTISPECIES: fumarate reductase/succinate dehydrogenase flavoprotein subunit [unclassified Herbaspirillum]|uniref:fumarate reductase/succinate dehydrogenase flavoprotein subunit n=1 Tax=unclassified Herbaspirillum TaxID=2624150 RepID=UPI000E2E4EFB|nr:MULTISPECIES: fumarate reductase/succinate dehydrogenase flavoprotein subunit [unclassified Herbaspirillum]RFB73188.1 fumarate reductase/succinate dehydrogenase flavoprotein subunit [Herbaspirillum sp. 3R-3a1]TFI11002.1 fumarate reductase/succinate dehydrogenase flavoprotein subunit [Herbaspirillum sp. 3R11]TFI16909.1 fumarate reductase/succinate dehydrogenase flavoprotein subunit [Herbaspirillum sp. 3R-11]TFI23418.1 fumarate reductase/succinate dehydrogenase flavoprotein subunit [Herbaspiri